MGGSADAVAPLLVLNEMFEDPLSQQALLDIATRIGADVPFCLHQGTALVQGIGELIN